jgi:hypothetical protein
MPCGGTLARLRVKTTAPGAGQSITYTVYKNGSATGLTVTIADAATTGENVANSVSYAAGDTISLELVTTAVSTAKIWSVVAEFNSSTSNQQPLFSLVANVDDTATEYAGISSGNDGSPGATESQRRAVMLTSGTISRLYIKAENAAGAAKSITVTVRKNGSDTALTTSISGSSQVENEDVSNSFTVAAGDVVDYQFTPSGTPTVGDFLLSCVFTPDIAGECILLATGTAVSADSYVGPQRTGEDATGSNVDTLLPEGTLKKLYVDMNVAPGAGDSWNIRVQINGSSGDLSVTVANTDTTGNDTANTQTVATGDVVRFFFDETGTADSTYIAVGAVWVFSGTPFGPTATGNFFLMF